MPLTEEKLNGAAQVQSSTTFVDYEVQITIGVIVYIDGCTYLISLLSCRREEE